MKLLPKAILYLSSLILCSLLMGILPACERKSQMHTRYEDSEGMAPVSFQLSIADRSSLLQENKTGYTPDATLLREATTLRITSPKGVVKAYASVADVPDTIYLQAGKYEVLATAFEEVQASLDTVAYKGWKPFEVFPKKSNLIALNCQVDGCMVKVNTSELEGYRDMQVKVYVDASHPLIFSKSKGTIDKYGYFRIPFSGASLHYSFLGIGSDGHEKVLNEQKIEHLQENQLYTLHFRKAANPGDSGFAAINVAVEETPLKESEETIVIHQSPRIYGEGVDLSQPLRCEPGKASTLQIIGKAAQPIESFTIASEQFALIGLSPIYHLIGLPDNIRNELKETGISYEYRIDPSDHTSAIQLHLSASFMNSFVQREGVYTLHLSLVAGSGIHRQEVTQEIVIKSSASAVINVEKSAPEDVWATKAILRGELLKETPGAQPIFKYRKKGDTQWIEVVALLSQHAITAEVKHLSPRTSYEFKAALHGGDESSVIGTFTTGDTSQLPNSSFEEWYQSGKYWSPNKSGSELFWDSANKGTTMLKESGTVPDASIRHSGERSVKIFSQNVSGMAGGTLYTGQFVSVNLFPAGANLSFGRPFQARPSSVNGWYKYSPGKVDYTSKKKPQVKEGDEDEGTIYAVLGDWEKPVDISTAKNKFIDVANDPHIIAYGEIVFKGKTTSKDLQPFSFELNYRSNRIPKYIILVAASSKNADYFVGSTSSILWIDDLHLNYE